VLTLLLLPSALALEAVLLLNRLLRIMVPLLNCEVFLTMNLGALVEELGCILMVLLPSICGMGCIFSWF